MQKKTFIRALTIIICLYLIVTTVQAIADLWKAGDKELGRQKRLSILQSEQRQLLAEKSLVSKQGYWEKIARDQLGMSQKGEENIVIPDELLQDKSLKLIVDTRPNWKKWWDLIL